MFPPLQLGLHSHNSRSKALPISIKQKVGQVRYMNQQSRALGIGLEMYKTATRCKSARKPCQYWLCRHS